MSTFLLAVALAPILLQAPPSERHDFDFWIGSWEVFDAKGQPVGRNRITRVSGEAALLEQWEDMKGGTGTSLNFYDRGRKQWRQTWMGAGGMALDLAGGLSEGRMVLQGEHKYPKGPMVDRITWTPLEKDGQGRVRVRQFWEQSADGGRTWSPVFDGIYVRRD